MFQGRFHLYTYLGRKFIYDEHRDTCIDLKAGCGDDEGKYPQKVSAVTSRATFLTVIYIIAY